MLCYFINIIKIDDIRSISYKFIYKNVFIKDSFPDLAISMEDRKRMIKVLSHNDKKTHWDVFGDLYLALSYSVLKIFTL